MDAVVVVECVWLYMGCTDSGVDEKVCRNVFNKCSDEVIEENGDQIPDGPRPDIPALEQTGDKGMAILKCIVFLDEKKEHLV